MRSMILMAVFASTVGVARVAPAQVLTEAEFACQAAVSRATARFVRAKGECTRRCVVGAWKGRHPLDECEPPYAGRMAACVRDPENGVKGAEGQFQAAIERACNPAIRAGAECPACYYDGNCGVEGEAGSRMQRVSRHLESMAAGIYCEVAGASAAELRCELETGKALAKLTGAIARCYDRCHAAARSGVHAPSACVPPAPSDPATAACVAAAERTSMARIERRCADTVPDGCVYPNGAYWTNLVSLATSGDMPSTYCEQ